MSSPSIKLAKSSQSSSSLEDDVVSTKFSFKKVVFCYIIIIFALLLICKPSFILKKETLNDVDKNVSYTKLFLWELILCIPLIFYYIINY